MPDARPQAGPKARVVLSFDYGLKYIGVAVGQRITGTASPMAPVRANQGKPDWPAIERLIREWQPDQLIVGEPLNMDDTQSEMADRAARFARQLEGRYGLPVALIDERLTSREAAQMADTPADRHGIAAMLIAESWLAETGRS